MTESQGYSRQFTGYKPLADNDTKVYEKVDECWKFIFYEIIFVSMKIKSIRKFENHFKVQKFFIREITYCCELNRLHCLTINLPRFHLLQVECICHHLVSRISYLQILLLLLMLH